MKTCEVCGKIHGQPSAQVTEAVRALARAIGDDAHGDKITTAELFLELAAGVYSGATGKSASRYIEHADLPSEARVPGFRARLALATTFQLPDGKHIQCFFGSANDPTKPSYLLSEDERVPGWYVFDNHHDRILAIDGTWTPDKDGWDTRHRFSTVDEAFAAVEKQP